jgi:hypothetical protein
MGHGNNGRLPLAHRRIMVLEDDFLVKSSLETMLEKAGAMISSVYHPRLEAAILDIHIERGPSSAQIARELSRRSVPFLFYTGQPNEVLAPIRAEWPDVLVMVKPVPPETILQTLVDLLARRRAGHTRTAKGGGPTR